MHYYLEVLKKYAVFKGRAQRAEYWYFALFNFIATIILGILDNVLGTKTASGILGIFYSLYYLAVLIPSLAVSVRRLHDTNRSGWWLFLSIVPLVGAVVLIVFMVMDGTPGQNKYGPNPKGAKAA